MLLFTRYKVYLGGLRPWPSLFYTSAWPESHHSESGRDILQAQYIEHLLLLNHWYTIVALGGCFYECAVCELVSGLFRSLPHSNVEVFASGQIEYHTGQFSSFARIEINLDVIEREPENEISVGQGSGALLDEELGYQCSLLYILRAEHEVYVPDDALLSANGPGAVYILTKWTKCFHYTPHKSDSFRSRQSW